VSNVPDAGAIGASTRASDNISSRPRRGLPLRVTWSATAKSHARFRQEGVDKSSKDEHDYGVKLTAAYKQVGDCWAAWIEEIPGVHTQGDTLEEARENLKDAVRMVLEANRELSEQEHEASRREDLVVV
jgi:predicted RNase H-like HicB family nuclease